MKLQSRLTWPDGWKRTTSRKQSRFPRQLISERCVAIKKSLDLFGAKEIIVTSNAPMAVRENRYKEPTTRAEREIEDSDPGVSIYFERKGKSYSMACDKYVTIQENLRALDTTLEAMRTIERHGSSELLERQFQGYEALPSRASTIRPHWSDVLGVNPDSSLAFIEQEYRSAAKRAHSDSGGSDARMTELNLAIEQARKEKESK